jgi:hypothetical protein
MDRIPGILETRPRELTPLTRWTGNRGGGSGSEPHGSTRKQPTVDKPTVVVVRLVRGSSGRALWVFRTSDLGASVSIGAGKHCNWCLSTGGLEISELTLLFAGGTLLARREQPGTRVRLNGEPIGDDWTFVGHGSRVEIGLACLEFNFATDYPSRLPVLQKPDPVHAGTVKPSTGKQGGGDTAQGHSPTDPRVALVLRSGAALAVASSNNAPPGRKQPPLFARAPEGALRPEDRPRKRHALETSKQSLETRRPPDWVQACIPADRRASSGRSRTGRTKLTRYALYGLGLALFYAAWLVLLEPA